MMEKVLPLNEQRAGVIASAINLNQDFASGYLSGQIEQRDADWEWVKPLVEAGRYLLIKAQDKHYTLNFSDFLPLQEALAQRGNEVKS